MADIIEGRNPVLEALKSGHPVSKVLLARNVDRHGTIAEILYLAKQRGVPVEYLERQALDRMGESHINQGVVALAAAKEYLELDDLFSITREKGEPAFYVVLDGIEDPYNLGAILRTAEASGAQGVVIRERRAAGLTSSVVKASAGAVEYVPVARVVNISQTIETLKSKNIWVVGIDQSAEQDFTSLDYRPPTAIVIGGEGKGLSDLVKKKCDFLARIPMKGRISSLNASVAAAVVMYEVVKQRDRKP
jgi:23S rRNA (guanosine2251-2'-O)-methyltransferase